MTDGPEQVQEGAGGAGRKISPLVIALIALGAMLGVAILLGMLFLRPYSVPSISMAPTIEPGSKVVIDKLTYRFTSPSFGEMVLFKSPGSGNGPEELIKRVIGLPGDRISITNGVVYRNSKPLREDYISKSADSTNFPQALVPEGEYFLLGDNRPDSMDSRFFGPVDRGSISGRVLLIF